MHDVFTRSAALAYYLLFAIFPSLLFLYSVLGLFNIDWLNLLSNVKQFIPADAYKVICAYAEYLTPKTDMTFLLSGLITAIYSSYRAVRCIRTGLSLAFESNNKRTIWQEFFRSIVFTILLYFSVVLYLLIMPILSGVFEFLSNYFIISDSVFKIWGSVKNILVVIPFILCLCMLYYISPDDKIPFSIVLPGAVFSTVGIYCSASAFNILTINTFRYSTTYGSLAIIVVFILWLYVISAIILIGGEITAMIWYNNNYAKD